MRLLFALCTLLLPSVMGMHKLQRLHDTALETSGVEAEALVQARALATTMEQEMFQHLLSTSNQQELAVDAVYNEKRIGIEVSIHTPCWHLISCDVLSVCLFVFPWVDIG